MAEEIVSAAEESGSEDTTRVYEVGYHIAPTVKDEDVEKIVAGVRQAIEGQQGSFIAEGAPSLMRLAYPIEVRDNGKRTRYDRGYFGWIKFEASPEASQALSEYLKKEASVIRFLVFRTVREDTRAKMKAPTLREVKRGDTIRSKVRRSEDEGQGPVSEEKLEQALDVLTAE